MSVSGTNFIAGPFAGDGVTKGFAYPNYYLDPSHLTVVLTDAAGVPVTQTYNTDYTVAGTQDPVLGTYPSGGTVTMTTAPAIDETLTISRSTPKLQPVNLTALGQISSAAMEVAQDRRCLIEQELSIIGNVGTPRFIGFISDNPITLGISIPSVIGDYYRNSVPQSGGPSGWVCVASGTPGTWVAEGIVQDS